MRCSKVNTVDCIMCMYSYRKKMSLIAGWNFRHENYLPLPSGSCAMETHTQTFLQWEAKQARSAPSTINWWSHIPQWVHVNQGLWRIIWRWVDSWDVCVNWSWWHDRECENPKNVWVVVNSPVPARPLGRKMCCFRSHANHCLIYSLGHPYVFLACKAMVFQLG